MAKGSEVLSMLLPDGGWILSGEKFEDIEFIDDRAKCTKAQFEAGFAAYDAWKSEQDAAKAADKEALLDRLGITADEAKLLLS
jgi:hypothetical protein